METLSDRLVSEGRLTRGHADELLAADRGALLQMIAMGILYDVDAPAGQEVARRDEALVDAIKAAAGEEDDVGDRIRAAKPDLEVP
jgi:hypothetical protein